MMSEAIDHEVKSGHLTWIVFETEIFVDTLLERGSETDLFEAQRAVERLSRTRPTEDWVIRDVTLLRLNALLARARGDDETYAEFRDSYRVAVNELGFEGHMAKAAAMT